MPLARSQPVSHELPTSSSDVHQQLCAYCELPLRSAQQTEAYCCYGCQLAAQITQDSGSAGQVNWLLTRLGFATFLSMGVMVFTIFLYSQEVYVIERSPLQHSLTGLMRYLSLLFAAPVMLLLGVPIALNAASRWSQGILEVDSLITLGVGAAFIYSYISTIQGHGSTYYETACMVLVLVTLGRWLEAIGKHKATETIRSLTSLIPKKVLVRTPEGNLRVPAESLRPGDILIAEPGQWLAADGVILEGRGQLDEHLLSGESVPVSKTTGDRVSAGTIPIDASIVVRVERVGQKGTLGTFWSLLEAARMSKGRYERLADAIARKFVGFTMVFAIVAAFVAYFRAGFEDALLTTLAVLLIACPCALGIATPLAMWVGLGRAARAGILVKNPNVLEQLAKVDTICFDKTGTLTAGQAQLVDIRVQPMWDVDRALEYAASLAEQSSHVHSKTLFAEAQKKSLRSRNINEVSVLPGLGLQGRIDGQQVYLGSMELMQRQECADLGHDDGTTVRTLDQDSTCFLAVDRTVVASFSFEEHLRDNADNALTQISHLGIHVECLTGDHVRRAEVLTRQLDIQTYAQLKPSDKLEHLRRLRDSQHIVAMVGDGLNDSPALAQADVGIAMGCGADLSRDAADVCLVSNDLLGIPELVRIARTSIRAVRFNLFWAFAYNVIGMGFAFVGWLTPVLAALAMVLSSAMVVGNALALTIRTEEPQ